MTVVVIDLFWRYALAAIPLAILVAVGCRCLPCRPSTRHTLWLTVLLFMVVAPLLPTSPAPDLAALLPTPAGEVSTDPDLSPPRRPAASLPPRRGFPAADPTESDREKHGERGSLERPATDGTSDTGITRTDSSEPLPALARPRAVSLRPETPSAGLPRPAGPVPAEPRITAAPSANLALAKPERAEPRPTKATRIETPLVQPPPAEPDPVDRAAVAGAPGPAVSATTGWLVQVRQIRDAVLGLPAIPAAIWGGGAALVFLVLGLRILRFQRLLSTARPAPADAVRLVATSSQALGLRRTPVTLTVDARISPMVWCGRRTCLLLPERLWEQLDRAGRRAVIHHELAHLRRRDHWVCWLTTIIGCAYWWHPLVWWIRRRLREEADLSCDAWVTSLMPDARREYAHALLETKKFTCVLHAAVPAVRLGVLTMPAKRFARRLTMVMTQQLSPRLTFGGAALACALAATSWLATPTLACPPSPKGVSESAAVPKATPPTAPVYVRVRPLTANPVPVAPLAPRASTFERFMSGQDDDNGLDDRMDALERKLERLVEQIKRWSAGMDDRIPEMRQLMQRLRDVELTAPKIKLEGLPDNTRGLLRELARGRGAVVPRADDDTGGRVTSKTYELSEGKLEALTKLMVRADVPILVSPGDGQITVQGTPAQHLIFGGFVYMIESDENVGREYALPEGKLEALTELMIRSDVPIRVRPGDEAIGVQGTELEQAVFEAFVNMIHPTKKGSSTRAVGRGNARSDATEERYRGRAVAQARELASFAGQLRGLERGAQQYERKRDQTLAKAERAVKKAAELEGKADHYRKLAKAAKDDRGRDKYLEKAEKCLAKVRACVEQAEALEAAAAEMETQAEALEAEAEALAEVIEATEIADSRDDDRR